MLPIGKTSQDLPVGIQIIGKPFADLGVVSVSEAINKLIVMNS